MKKNNSILIIGAGRNQVPIIQTAKNLGYRVIVVSPSGDYPGIQMADEVLYEDVLNKDAIVEFAKNRGIGGVLTDQSDFCTPTVAYIAEKLGLPGYGYHNALCFTNKALMRDVYREVGLPIIPYRRVKDFDNAVVAASNIGYPVVIKPEDSFSSRGVLRVSTEAELSEKYSKTLSFSSNGWIIVEKLIQGSQFFSQGFVDEYKLNMFAFSDRYYFNLPDMFLPYTNAFPAKISEELKQRMTYSFEKIIEHLKPKFGQVWGEWIFDEKSDVLYMIEMAIRGAGAFVTTDVIPRAYGIDTMPYLVESAMGHGPVNFSTENMGNYAAAFYCFLLPSGKVISVEGIDEIDRLTGVIKTNLPSIMPGDVVPPYKDKSSRYGPIIIAGNSRDELDRIRDRMIKTLKIIVKTDDGEKGIIWE